MTIPVHGSDVRTFQGGAHEKEEEEKNGKEEEEEEECHGHDSRKTTPNFWKLIPNSLTFP